MSEKLDILIRGGKVVDGTGSPWVREDIGIREGRIARIGALDEDGRKTIDAKGMVASPGFVDLHTHNDLTILAHRDAESYIMQGVTTACVGNCGLSLVPVSPDSLGLLKRYLAPFLVSDFEYGWDWKTFREYYEKVEDGGISQNLAPLVGQGSIRLAVKGFDSARASGDEMGAMKQLLEESLEEGAFGMSTGLIYPPGSYSSTEELVELGAVLSRYGAIYATHLRNEGDRLMESLDEAIRIGEANGVGVEISHHKAAGRANWGKVHATLRAMEQARQRGVEINCDVYPYTAGSTTITALLPVWAQEGGVDRMLERLASQEIRSEIRRQIAEGSMEGERLIEGAGWEGIVVGECPSRREFEGKSLASILKERSGSDDLCERFFDWLLEIQGNSTMVLFHMDEDDVKTVMSSPLSSIISDAWVTTPSSGGKPHPRAYGTFPRVLGKYAREERVLTLEDAIRKMTSLPAGKLGLEKRGLIKEDFWADIVVFDPDTIADTATYAEPHQYPKGIEYVIVNGEVVVENGRLTGARPGRVLKRA